MARLLLAQAPTAVEKMKPLSEMGAPYWLHLAGGGLLVVLAFLCIVRTRGWWRLGGLVVALACFLGAGWAWLQAQGLRHVQKVEDPGVPEGIELPDLDSLTKR